jgi:hypothetical protein
VAKQEGITRVVLNLNWIIRDLATALCNASDSEKKKEQYHKNQRKRHVDEFYTAILGRIHAMMHFTLHICIDPTTFY